MTAVQGPDGKWFVEDEYGKKISGLFDTEEEALQWIGDHTPKPPRPRMT